MKPVRTHSFSGVKYQIYINEDGVLGYCDNANEKEKLELAILVPLNTQQGLEIAIHEAVHALCPKVREDEVCGLGKELARWLWRLGYRTDYSTLTKEKTK